MNGSGLGRPGAQNEYFLNKALIKIEQIRARTAKTPKWISFKSGCNQKWTDPGPDGQGPKMNIF